MEEAKPFSEEGYQLMNAAFEVHQTLGGGLLEEVYQESLEIELEIRKIPFEGKSQLSIFYKDRELKKKYSPDLVAFGEVIVELKAVSAIAPEHEAQLINYLRITGKRIGYLINFGPIKKVEWKRYII